MRMDQTNSPSSGCVAFNLRRASRIVTRRYEDALRPLNLTSFQFTTLAALSDYPAIPLSAMADAFGMSNSTLTRNLKHMEVKDLIKIEVKAEDARVKLVSISAKGRRLMKKALPLWHQAQDQTLKDLSGPQWMTLKQAIRDLA